MILIMILGLILVVISVILILNFALGKLYENYTYPDIEIRKLDLINRLKKYMRPKNR